MPRSKRGLVAPQNNIIDAILTLTKRYAGSDTGVLLANARIVDYPLVYANESFTRITGFTRPEVMLKPCLCTFLHGELTDRASIARVKRALERQQRDQLELLLYKRNHMPIWLLMTLAPIKNEKDVIVLYLITFKDITSTAWKQTEVAAGRSSNAFDRESSLTRDYFAAAAGESSGSGAVPLSRIARIVLESKLAQQQLQAQQLTSPSTTFTPNGLLVQPPSAITPTTTFMDDVVRPRIITTTSHISDATTATRRHQRAPQSTITSYAGGGGVGSNSSILQAVNMSPEMMMPQYRQEAPKTPPHIILHYTPFKTLWDWMILLLTFYTSIMVPYNVAFESKTMRNVPLLVLDSLVDIIFFVDIVLNFHTTFVGVNGQVISDPKVIRWHYLKTWFFIDLLSCLPYDVVNAFDRDDDSVGSLFSALKVIRLLRVGRVLRKLDHYLEYGAAVLMLLLAAYMLFAHWFACIWYTIGRTELLTYNYTYNWLWKLANDTAQPNPYVFMSGPGTYTAYVTALYFTVSGMTSIGFGNVAAYTDNEKLFVIAMMIIGALLYAIIFGHVTTTISQMASTTARYHDMLNNFRDFMKIYDVPKALAERVMDYVQSTWAITNGIDTDKILNFCPKDMKADLCVHLNRKVFNDHAAFRLASDGCLRALAMHFTMSHSAPGDLLFHVGESVDQLCFVVSGSIEIVQDDEVVAILSKGDVFGDTFWRPEHHVGQACANVRALTYTDIHAIRRDELLDVLDFYHGFAQSFSRNLHLTYNLRHRNLFRKIADVERERELAERDRVEQKATAGASSSGGAGESSGIAPPSAVTTAITSAAVTSIAAASTVAATATLENDPTDPGTSKQQQQNQAMKKLFTRFRRGTSHFSQQHSVQHPSEGGSMEEQDRLTQENSKAGGDAGESFDLTALNRRGRRINSTTPRNSLDAEQSRLIAGPSSASGFGSRRDSIANTDNMFLSSNFENLKTLHRTESGDNNNTVPASPVSHATANAPAKRLSGENVVSGGGGGGGGGINIGGKKSAPGGWGKLLAAAQAKRTSEEQQQQEAQSIQSPQQTSGQSLPRQTSRTKIALPLSAQQQQPQIDLQFADEASMNGGTVPPSLSSTPAKTFTIGPQHAGASSTQQQQQLIITLLQNMDKKMTSIERRIQTLEDKIEQLPK